MSEHQNGTTLETTILIPTVHVNGTGSETLLEEYRAAVVAVIAAIEKVGQLTVHGRDYYVQSDPRAVYKAMGQRDAHVAALLKVKDELERIWIGIYDQTTGGSSCGQ